MGNWVEVTAADGDWGSAGKEALTHLWKALRDARAKCPQLQIDLCIGRELQDQDGKALP